MRDPCRPVEWIGFHLGELVGVAVPAALAVTVTWWFALITLVVALGWASHELRLHRHRRALTAAQPPAITTRDPRADRGEGGEGGEGGTTETETEWRAWR